MSQLVQPIELLQLSPHGLSYLYMAMFAFSLNMAIVPTINNCIILILKSCALFLRGVRS